MLLATLPTQGTRRGYGQFYVNQLPMVTARGIAPLGTGFTVCVCVPNRGLFFNSDACCFSTHSWCWRKLATLPGLGPVWLGVNLVTVLAGNGMETFALVAHNCCRLHKITFVNGEGEELYAKKRGSPHAGDCLCWKSYVSINILGVQTCLFFLFLCWKNSFFCWFRNSILSQSHKLNRTL